MTHYDMPNGAYAFGPHDGHLTDKADEIAEAHGARHINYFDPALGKRGWFETDNRGFPHNEETAETVMEAIWRTGGIDAYRKRS